MTQARRVKIGLIGPVLPFRGGIAQYTTQLHRALMEISNPVTISFQRQYPAWLFPGQSNRDPFCEGHKEPRVLYSIDPYRPNTWLRSVEHLRAEGVERVILSWWTAYWGLCYDKPVVVTRVGGLPEVVEEGLSGFIVEPGDADRTGRSRGAVPRVRPLPRNHADIEAKDVLGLFGADPHPNRT